MHKEAAEGGAALPGRAHGGESDGAQGELEIRRRRHNGGVVAAELEDRPGKAGGELGTDRAAHGRRAGGRDHWDTMIFDEDLTELPPAEDELREAVRHVAKALGSALDDRLDSERRERGLLGGLPDD